MIAVFHSESSPSSNFKMSYYFMDCYSKCTFLFSTIIDFFFSPITRGQTELRVSAWQQNTAGLEKLCDSGQGQLVTFPLNAIQDVVFLKIL